jgi:glycosyltransferase involved in cell wall biosynthesis
MIVKDGALTIARSLESLRSYDEVIVFDNGSSDGTQEIARQYTNVRMFSGEFEGFGATKNKAVTLAKHDWIFIIDSDEVIEPELAQAMHLSDLDVNFIYVLNFKAFYKDYQVKYCGWNNQKIRRLYNRQATRFSDNYVHENLIDTGLGLAELKGGSIRHFSYHGVSDLIKKVERYSSLFAEGTHSCSPSRRRVFASPSQALFNGIYSFFKTYVLKRGFLDGHVGLLIAFSHMATNFYKYMKLYERKRERAMRQGQF